MHSLVPAFANSHELFIAVGIIGATVIPNVVFLHSTLTKERSVSRTLDEKKKIQNLHHVETVIVLSVAGMINASIQIISAVAFNPAYSEVQSISEVYKTLIPLFGIVAGIVFLIILLSSCLASSVAGTLVGQAIMEGFLGKKVNVWLRRVITRFINVMPTIAILLGF